MTEVPFAVWSAEIRGKWLGASCSLNGNPARISMTADRDRAVIKSESEESAREWDDVDRVMRKGKKFFKI